MATFGKQTGPRTDAGKLSVTANLAGHPTAEEAKRTRFNAMSHGLTAQVATYFPAKPGKYPICDSCDIDWGECYEQAACLKRTELFLRHRIAFETRDPRQLTDLRADMHASMQALISDMIRAIIATGTELKEPDWFVDKDGNFRLAKYQDTDGEQRLITKVSAHPLLKVLGEMISRNSLSLADMGMTPKGQEDDALLRGHLDAEAGREESLLEFQRRSTEAQEGLLALIKNSHNQAEPVLIEQQPEEAGSKLSRRNSEEDD